MTENEITAGGEDLRRPVEDIARDLCIGSVHGERGAIECRCEQIAAALRSAAAWYDSDAEEAHGFLDAIGVPCAGLVDRIKAVVRPSRLGGRR